jgi:hypothetical protein
MSEIEITFTLLLFALAIVAVQRKGAAADVGPVTHRLSGINTALAVIGVVLIIASIIYLATNQTGT